MQGSIVPQHVVRQVWSLPVASSACAASGFAKGSDGMGRAVEARLSSVVGRESEGFRTLATVAVV
jgi:hypothetical protein